MNHLPKSGTASPEHYGHLRNLLAKASSRAAIPYLLGGVALIAAIIVAGREIEHHIGAIEDRIDQLHPWALIAFIALFALVTSFLLPDTVMCIIAGTLFPFGAAFGAVMAGSFLGASIQYALARRLLHARIEHALASRPTMASIQKAVLRDERRLQFLLRLTPLNPASISYLLGAAGVRYRGFLLGCLALAPNLALGVYFGHAGKHAARMAGRDTQSAHMHDLVVIGGLVTCIAVMYFISKLARKAVMEAVAEAEG